MESSSSDEEFDEAQEGKEILKFYKGITKVLVED